ncbi:hypothetical protein F5Y16DRAFT_280206 [Xylariaceae sp. FL0255]|nr:hypothetical protein F5Y16DRAFT_280206 [Xylariaceae sp. FL0255]
MLKHYVKPQPTAKVKSSRSKSSSFLRSRSPVVTASSFACSSSSPSISSFPSLPPFEPFIYWQTFTTTTTTTLLLLRQPLTQTLLNNHIDLPHKLFPTIIDHRAAHISPPNTLLQHDNPIRPSKPTSPSPHPNKYPLSPPHMQFPPQAQTHPPVQARSASRPRPNGPKDKNKPHHTHQSASLIPPQ